VYQPLAVTNQVADAGGTRGEPGRVGNKPIEQAVQGGRSKDELMLHHDKTPGQVPGAQRGRAPGRPVTGDGDRQS
jgi:hypothetical protein